MASDRTFYSKPRPALITSQRLRTAISLRRRISERWRMQRVRARWSFAMRRPYEELRRAANKANIWPTRLLAPRETDCGGIGSAELLRSRRRPCRHRSSGLAMIELPGVIESGMPRRNGQRKPGTTRGSPRRSRTAKALRISRYAVKSRCARGWGGWGRLSDDGSRQHNSSTSEDPWGGGLPHLHGGARSSAQPDTVRDY